MECEAWNDDPFACKSHSGPKSFHKTLDNKDGHECHSRRHVMSEDIESIMINVEENTSCHDFNIRSHLKADYINSITSMTTFAPVDHESTLFKAPTTPPLVGCQVAQWIPDITPVVNIQMLDEIGTLGHRFLGPKRNFSVFTFSTLTLNYTSSLCKQLKKIKYDHDDDITQSDIFYITSEEVISLLSKLPIYNHELGRNLPLPDAIPDRNFIINETDHYDRFWKGNLESISLVYSVLWEEVKSNMEPLKHLYGLLDSTTSLPSTAAANLCQRPTDLPCSVQDVVDVMYKIFPQLSTEIAHLRASPVTNVAVSESTKQPQSELIVHANESASFETADKSVHLPTGHSREIATLPTAGRPSYHHPTPIIVASTSTPSLRQPPDPGFTRHFLSGSIRSEPYSALNTHPIPIAAAKLNLSAAETTSYAASEANSSVYGQLKRAAPTARVPPPAQYLGKENVVTAGLSQTPLRDPIDKSAYGLARVVRKEGSTVRDAVDIDSSNKICILQYLEEVLVRQTTILPPPDADCLPVTRLQIVVPDAYLSQAPRGNVGEITLGWTSMTGRILTDNKPIMEMVRPIPVRSSPNQTVPTFRSNENNGRILSRPDGQGWRGGSYQTSSPTVVTDDSYHSNTKVRMNGTVSGKLIQHRPVSVVRAQCPVCDAQFPQDKLEAHVSLCILNAAF